MWPPGGRRLAWLVASIIVSTAVLIPLLTHESAAARGRRAQAAAYAGDWTLARSIWESINATRGATAASYHGEAKACLSLGLAARAEQLLRKAVALDPTDVESWRLLLQILRVESRIVDSQRLGWRASELVNPDSRRVVLLELTLSLLAELPDSAARRTLSRWIQADPDDIDARVALFGHQSAEPSADDPDRASLLASLEALVASHPDHTQARETLVTALADAGEPNRGRERLDQWPESTRDARYQRLRGRWDLEYDHHPDSAVGLFRSALETFPQDWRSWYRLARAYRALGRQADAQAAALQVGRIREILDPATLGRRLDDAFNHLDEPAPLADLARLCDQAGLHRLAEAWRTEARQALAKHNPTG